MKTLKEITQNLSVIVPQNKEKKIEIGTMFNKNIINMTLIALSLTLLTSSIIKKYLLPDLVVFIIAMFSAFIYIFLALYIIIIYYEKILWYEIVDDNSPIWQTEDVEIIKNKYEIGSLKIDKNMSWNFFLWIWNINNEKKYIAYKKEKNDLYKLIELPLEKYFIKENKKLWKDWKVVEFKVLWEYWKVIKEENIIEVPTWTFVGEYNI